MAPCPTDIIFRTVTSIPSIPKASVGILQHLMSCFSPDDPAVQGLDKSRHLQTGEMIIIVVVLVMWAGRFKLC